MKSVLVKPRKKTVKSQQDLIKQLKKLAEELKWEIHIPINDAGEVVPYVIMGSALFTKIVMDHLDKTGLNRTLSRTIVDPQSPSKKQT
jgi:hypothetical protein